jgi:nucleoside 2-deoxyribosyltransferase
LEVEKKFRVEIVNPFFDVDREDEAIIKEDGLTLTSLSSRDERYGLTDEQCDKLVNRDIKLITECDGIIAIVDGSLSYGTIQEMVYAKTLGLKVYSVVSNGHAGHPWLRFHSTKVFRNLNELYHEFVVE